MQNFLARRMISEEMKVEVAMGSLQGDAKIYSLGINLPESMDEFWATMDDRFGDPEASRLEALK